MAEAIQSEGAVPVNFLGKLMELGQKCKFVVDLEVIDVPSTNNLPNFKCILQIMSHDILVEQVAANKKAAKAAAAQIAFEKICDKINENHAASVEKIALKLKETELSSDKITSTINFAKKLSSLDVSRVNVNGGSSFSELNALISAIQCTLSYKHGERKSTDGSTEFQFVCEVRPTGSLSPVVTGSGWSSANLDEAKTNAVNQLLAVLKAYASQ